MEVVSQMKHVMDAEVDFDTRLVYRYMMSIKEADGAGIWCGHCPHWFTDELSVPLLSSPHASWWMLP